MKYLVIYWRVLNDYGQPDGTWQVFSWTRSKAKAKLGFKECAKQHEHCQIVLVETLVEIGEP